MANQELVWIRWEIQSLLLAKRCYDQIPHNSTDHQRGDCGDRLDRSFTNALTAALVDLALRYFSPIRMNNDHRLMKIASESSFILPRSENPLIHPDRDIAISIVIPDRLAIGIAFSLLNWCGSDISERTP
jgi:hypothetical protein